MTSCRNFFFFYAGCIGGVMALVAVVNEGLLCLGL